MRFPSDMIYFVWGFLCNTSMCIAIADDPSKQHPSVFSSATKCLELSLRMNVYM